MSPFLLATSSFQKNLNELTKVTKLAKICPIWSPWIEATQGDSNRLAPLLKYKVALKKLFRDKHSSLTRRREKAL